jgi:hypothetical protein
MLMRGVGVEHRRDSFIAIIGFSFDSDNCEPLFAFGLQRRSWPFQIPSGASFVMKFETVRFECGVWALMGSTIAARAISTTVPATTFLSRSIAS